MKLMKEEQIKTFYNYQMFESDLNNVYKKIKNSNLEFKGIYAIPRGGAILGVRLSYLLNIPVYFDFMQAIENIPLIKDLLIVDDLSDSGNTLLKIPFIKDYTTATLLIKENTKYKPTFYSSIYDEKNWLVFWWEE